ncbi:class I SAM-dependent methyltransferase [Luedemannella flava]
MADVGCGGAGMALATAGALPPTATVVALDVADHVLDAARRHVAIHLPRRHARLVFARGSVEDGPEALRAALGGAPDLVWASALVHHLGDQQGTVDTLAGLLPTGGRLALYESGLMPRHLPYELEIGAPGLEARLEAAQGPFYSKVRTETPGAKPLPYGWTEVLHRAGLGLVDTISLVIEHRAPLSADRKKRVLAWLAMRVGNARQVRSLTTEDDAAWTRLLDPHDRAWLGHREDIYRLEARTVHIGTRP